MDGMTQCTPSVHGAGITPFNRRGGMSKATICCSAAHAGVCSLIRRLSRF